MSEITFNAVVVFDGMTMPTFQHGQSAFHYRLMGCKSGPKLFFLHGFLGTGADFLQIIRQLSERFRCLIVDLPGHGKTEVQDAANYQMDQVSDGLVAMIRQLNHGPCYLVGYSMGGRLALYMACHYPQYFSGVFLESTSPGLMTLSERTERQRQDEDLAVRLQSCSFPAFVREWYRLPLFAGLAKHPKFETLVQTRCGNRPIELGRSLMGMGTGVQPSLWEPWSTLRLPTTLVVGTLDSKFVSINQAMAARSKQAQFILVPHCGHAVHFEAPEQFAAILQRAVADLPS